MVNSIIFDLDGTLLNTLDDLYSSVNHALSSYHLPVRSKWEVRSFLGNGVRRLVEHALPEGCDAELNDDMTSIKQNTITVLTPQNPTTRLSRCCINVSSWG